EAKRATVAYLYPVQDALLFQPNTSRSSGMGTSGFTGQNPAPGARIAYLVNGLAPDAKPTLSVVDASGTVVRELSVNKQPGLYRAVWDMRVGPPLTGPVLSDSAVAALAAAGRGGGRGGFGGRGGGGGGGGGGGAPNGR